MRYHTNHAVERAWERYGIILNDAASTEIVSMINNGQYRRLWPVQKVMHYELKYADKLICVVYDLTQRKIITLQPPNSLGPKRPKGRKTHPRAKRVAAAFA